jgi:hypothetical protein
MNTDQDIFIFTVSQILLLQLVILLGRETVQNTCKLRLSIVNWYVILTIFFIVMFQYAIVSGNKKYLELPHLWMIFSLILTSTLVYDKRVLFINIVLLLLVVISRLVCNDCPIHMSGNENKTFIPECILNLNSNLNSEIDFSTFAYFTLLVVNMYKFIN